MTKTSEIFKAVFNLALTALGIFIIYKVYWTNSSLKYLGVVSWFLIGYGTYKFSIAITKLVFPEKTVNSWTLYYSFKTFKKIVGTKTAFSVYLFFFFVFACSFGASWCLVFSSSSNYFNNQLTKYGEKQKVIIKKIGYLGKGSPYAFFDFYFNGKTYSDHLSAREFSVNDTATIIFSTQNPDVNYWADEFSSQ